MYELKDYLKAINESKEPLLDTEDVMWEKKYPTFIINRCLSMFYDTVMHSNEMNGLHFLPKRMQFHYFINSIRKKKRFGGKWLSQKKVKDLEVIKEFLITITIILFYHFKIINRIFSCPRRETLPWFHTIYIKIILHLLRKFGILVHLIGV